MRNYALSTEGDDDIILVHYDGRAPVIYNNGHRVDSPTGRRAALERVWATIDAELGSDRPAGDAPWRTGRGVAGRRRSAAELRRLGDIFYNMADAALDG
jgi:hypothetical protein